MNKKHLLAISGILLIGILLFAAYNSHSLHSEHMHTASSRQEAISSHNEAVSLRSEATVTESGDDARIIISGMGVHATFECVIEVATDVVVVEFVARRPFGQGATEYELIVHDRIYGSAADTIFVYVVYNQMNRSFAAPEFQFTTDTQYLLALIKLVNIYASFHYDGFMFIEDLILDLDNPSRSTMHNEPLAIHSYLDFNSIGLTIEHVISYVRSLPRNPFATTNRVFITSDNLADIINGSPYVLVIEVNEPHSLASQGYGTEFASTDIYYTTIVEVLKGGMRIGDSVAIIFFADTIFPGETHLVSVTPSSPNNPNPFYYRFTSRYSLHCLDQRDEIMAIIRGPSRPGTASSSTPSPTPEPSPTPTPTPTPTPSPVPASLRFSASPYDPDVATAIQLSNIDIDLPEDFVSAMIEIDDLNAMFLQEEMHSIVVAAEDIISIINANQELNEP
ncbi:MAG: hypothetical protein FWC66_10520 [Oscillospiraceae bacterium]|nr:hypothetical protein [Oscillospiraceae bacterium]